MAAARHLHLIMHAKAASHPELRAAVTRARSLGHRITPRVTWEPGDAAIYAAEAHERGVDGIVAAGGDGTLHEIVNSLARVQLPTPVPLGVIPMGTANDFAVGLELPVGDPWDALRICLVDPVQEIDLGRLNDQYFVNMASGGVGPQITRDTPEGIKWWFGGMAYFISSLAALPVLEPTLCKVRVPGWQWEGPVFVLAVGNGRLAGGGVPVCARAAVNDGLLDLLVISDLEDNDVITLVTNLMRLHQPPSNAQTIYRQVPWVEVEARHPMTLTLDGEPLSGDRFRWDVLPRQLRMFLPPI
ncbi:MAG TPA: lipid kinase YegS [Gemmatales bacterium]|nr:lipid kinase YegS [Gemmatales bacterium]HMP57886.1 lipid kinase YegS [Gemmatales bacterium]